MFGRFARQMNYRNFDMLIQATDDGRNIDYEHPHLFKII